MKPVSEFGANRAKADGFQSSCNSCRQVANAKYYLRSRVKFSGVRAERHARVRAENARKLTEYLLLHPCVDCGETDIVVLVFDHQGNKVADVGALAGQGVNWSRIAAEIAKCEVVCANDHARRTAASQGWYKSTLASSEAEHSALNGGVGISKFSRGTAA